LEQPKTPTQISKHVKVSTSHVSRTLAQFIDKGIAKCLTPKEKVGKVYELTEEGKNLLEVLKGESSLE